MIYEVRTYDLKPRSVPEVEKRFAESLPVRQKYSPLAAFFHTEIGPLNQIIHIYPYENLEERTRVRAEAAKEEKWPPKIQEFITNMTSEIFIPYEFSPELKPGKMGPIFEYRTYTVEAGTVNKLPERWGPALPERIKLSPLVAVWYSDIGHLSKYVHIWAYQSLDHRMEVRNTAREKGIWPPPPQGSSVLTQENKILLPSAFSPLQ